MASERIVHARLIISAVNSAVNDWCKAIENKKCVDVIFLDFSRAFDSVPFNRLIIKYKTFGIFGNVLNWVTNFLTNRKQIVFVNNKYSEWSRVTSGVPQGTIFKGEKVSMLLKMPSNSIVFVNTVVKQCN